MGFTKNPLLDPKNPRWWRSAILKIDMTSFLSAEDSPIWIKFCRLVQNDMSTAVIWPKWEPEVEFQHGGRLGMSSQSHLPHCRVLPPGKFAVMIPEPHATLQGADCSHLAKSMQGIRIPSAILKIVFRHILFFCFLNAVLALTSGGFRIISDTLVKVVR